MVDHPFSGSTTPVRKIRFGPPPNNTQILPYSYVTTNTVVTSAGAAATEFSSDSDEPAMPLQYRHVIVFGALVQFYEHRKGDTERAATARNEYLSLLSRMLDDQDIGAQKLEIRTAKPHYKARAKFPWRGSSGRYDVNNRFDRLED